MKWGPESQSMNAVDGALESVDVSGDGMFGLLAGLPGGLPDQLWLDGLEDGAGALLGEPLSRRWSERQWRKTGLVMADKRLEEATFTWRAITDGMMALNHAQFEALFARLDWRKVKALEARPPAATE